MMGYSPVTTLWTYVVNHSKKHEPEHTQAALSNETVSPERLSGYGASMSEQTCDEHVDG